MRPITIHVRGGTILVAPPGAIGPIRLSDALGYHEVLGRLAADRTALAELRRDWTRLGLPLELIHRTDADLTQTVADGVRLHRIALLWIPAGTSKHAVPETLRANPPADVAHWSRTEKITVALRRSVSGGNVSAELKTMVEELLSPVSIGVTAGLILTLAAANAAGVGALADVVLVAMAYAAAGYAGIRAIWDFAAATGEVMNATDEAAINRCAARYTHALRELGTAFLMRFLVKVKARDGEAGSKVEIDERIESVKVGSRVPPRLSPSYQNSASSGAGSVRAPSQIVIAKRVGGAGGASDLGIPHTLSPRQKLHLPPVKNGRSVLMQDPQALLDGLQRGDFKILRQPKPGQVVVDFGKEIGEFWSEGVKVGQSRYGLVSFGKNGTHIYPGNPVQR